ncbi:hypothetical protein [Streptomyces sp. MMBL 11-1]|uniref:hypothetical protein n=1 Tax=Streptomyces sp. MMBL 11-1 TaxID=3026420 RepID=UPI0023628DF5|nr:hypothetical protein [Streptomyces sp. MMBL 11-1]
MHERPAEGSRWSRAENFTAHEARSLRLRLSVRPSAVQTYVGDHGVSGFLAEEQLLDLVEEAAVNGSVLTRADEDVTRFALPRRIGQYHVMIDSQKMILFAYSNRSGARTWVESRTVTSRAAAAAEEVKKKQKAARKARERTKTTALCVTWDGEQVGRPPAGEPLRVWRQLRHVDIGLMVCNRAVPDCVYFSSVPEGARLAVMRARLAFVLSKVSQRQVRCRPDGFTVEHGPIAWHIRRDGLLVEQITMRTGRAQERFEAAGGP